MKFSVRYWIFCFFAAIILHFVPVIGTRFWWRLVLWYAIIRAFKRTALFFRQLPAELRFENQETVVVTGASAGIGAEVARQLCQRGAKVIWAARSTRKAQAVLDDIRWTPSHGPRGYVLSLDLADLAKIREFVDEFHKRESRLHCLILNAGYHGPKATTKEGFEQSFGVNHLGHMYLTSLLMDTVKASAPSRIVVVSSDLHFLCPRIRFHDLDFNEPGSYGWAGFSAYNHSKLANMLFVTELSKRLKGSEVTVHGAHPGTPVQTDLMRNNFLGGRLMNELLLPPLYHLYCRQASDGAQTILYCAVSPECQTTNGKYFENLERVEASKAANDEQEALRLWDRSCELIGIDHDWLPAPLS